MSGIVGSALAITEQKFATLPVSSLGKGVALYILSIREPGFNASPLPGYTYVFPMSPQAVKKETTFLNTIYDTQSFDNGTGVQRFVDMWGQSPPIYTLRGTTGWKRHSTDSFALTGKDSIGAVQDVMAKFTELNQLQLALQATDFYTLEFYDYWMNEYWQIVPIGPQGIDQNANAPLISTYTFRFAAIQAVDSPISSTALDLLIGALSTGAQQIQILNSNLALKLNSY